MVLQANGSQDRVRGSFADGELHDLSIVERVHIVSGGRERERERERERNVNYCDSEKTERNGITLEK